MAHQPLAMGVPTREPSTRTQSRTRTAVWSLAVDRSSSANSARTMVNAAPATVSTASAAMVRALEAASGAARRPTLATAHPLRQVSLRHPEGSRARRTALLRARRTVSATATGHASSIPTVSSVRPRHARPRRMPSPSLAATASAIAKRGRRRPVLRSDAIPVTPNAPARARRMPIATVSPA